MPILSPSRFYGETVFLGLNRDRDAGLESQPLEQVEVGYGGFEGEAHGGLTRPSCSRVKMQYPRGTEIRNARQITILSAEELAAIASDMDLPGDLKPEWVGANLVLRGLPQLTELPPGSRLLFEEGGVALTIDLENGPCKFPGEVIDRAHPGFGARFPKAAMGRRGLTAWVEKIGTIRLRERCRLHLPPIRLWAPAVEA